MKFCPNCGAPISEGVKFCMECGTKIALPEPSAPAEVTAEPPAPPVQPVYEPPVQQVYQPPVSPANRVYQSPVQQTYEKSPAAPARGGESPRQKKKGKVILFAVVGAVVVLAAVLLILLLVGGSEGDKTVWGRYEAVSAASDGGSVPVAGEWIELKRNGKAKLFLMDTEFSGTWTLNGNSFALKQDGDTYTGSLYNGVLSLELAGVSYSFAKEGEAPVTYKATTCISGGQILDEELMDMIGGCFIRLNADGTGVFYCFGEKVELTYDEKSIRIGEDSMSYTIKGDVMEFTYVDGSVFTMELTQEDPEQASLADNGWDAEKWEDTDMESGTFAELDWIGCAVGQLGLEEATLSFHKDGYSGTLWLAANADGALAVERLDLYVYDMDFLSARDLLIEKYGEPTEESEEPYAEANGGAVTHCWFASEAVAVHLSSASEYEYLQIAVDAQ